MDGCQDPAWFTETAGEGEREKKHYISFFLSLLLSLSLRSVSLLSLSLSLTLSLSLSFSLSPTEEVPQRDEAAGFCHGRQLTSLNNENPRTPPPENKQEPPGARVGALPHAPWAMN